MCMCVGACMCGGRGYLSTTWGAWDTLADHRVSLGTPEASGRIGDGIDFGSASESGPQNDRNEIFKEGNWLVGVCIGTRFLESHRQDALEAFVLSALQPSLSTSSETVSKEAVTDTCKSSVAQSLGLSSLICTRGMLSSQPPSAEGRQKDDMPGAWAAVTCH